MRFAHHSLAVILATLTAAGASPALAHSEDTHDQKAGPVVKEQKDWGIAGDAKAAKRTVDVQMLDTMRFSPETLEVEQGETIRFVVRNAGAVMHEFVIGTKKENNAHAAMMLKHPGMEHDEPYMAHVAPGKTGEIVWTFNRPGDFDFACLIAGHYQAGMVGRITVVKAKAATAVAAAAGPVHSSPQAGDMTEGEVRKIDKDNGKLTLRHGEIRNLDMPSMTMVFQVREPAMLDKLKPGDKVRFSASKEGAAFVVTEIEAAK